MRRVFMWKSFKILAFTQKKSGSGQTAAAGLSQESMVVNSLF
ncbi:hypothetical protein ACFL50_00090 [Candidatus Latescibacterota bacterium]